MRFGVVLPLFGTSWQDVLGIALRAEDAGYDDVWVSDHLLGIPAPETSVLEGWTTLTALAAATERIGLGTLVLSATFRAPMVAAKSVETLAAVAGPRLTIGLGAGWRRGEHEAFGLTFPPLADRVALVDQAVDALRVRVPEVPLLLGGASDEIVRLAAAKADLWNAPGDRLDELPGLIERLGTECHATRREVAIAARVGLVLESTREKADARVARRESRWRASAWARWALSATRTRSSGGSSCIARSASAAF